MAQKGVIAKIKQHTEDYLSEFVYGGIDGAVTTFAVVAGATGARFNTQVILVLGFANLIADGFSMSVGAYLSNKSSQELMIKRGEPVVDEPSPVINGLATFMAFILVGLVPLSVFSADLLFDLQLARPFLLTSIMTGAAFGGIGLLKSRVAHAPVWRSVFETLILGTLAASLAYYLGDFLERVITG